MRNRTRRRRHSLSRDWLRRWQPRRKVQERSRRRQDLFSVAQALSPPRVLRLIAGGRRAQTRSALGAFSDHEAIGFIQNDLCGKAGNKIEAMRVARAVLSRGYMLNFSPR